MGWLAFALALSLIFIALATKCHAQTNAPPPSVTEPSPAAMKVADDLRQLVLDVFTLAGGVSWSGVIISAYLGIKALRNKTSLGQGNLAPLLNLLNLEAKTPPPTAEQMLASAAAQLAKPSAVASTPDVSVKTGPY